MAFAASQILGIPVGLYLANIWGWHAAFFMIVGLAILIGLVVAMAPARPLAETASAAARPVAFAEVQAVIDQRCALCHNATVQQKAIALHTPELIRQHAQVVYQQAVVLKTMPLNNATQMTDAERAVIQRWFEAGAPP